MCRKNQLCGCALVAFGLGLLIGSTLQAGAFCFFGAVTVISLGCWCMKKK